MKAAMIVSPSCVLTVIMTCFKCADPFYASKLKLDFLCTSTDRGHLYVRDLPWDVAGYVMCHNGRSIATSCPPGFYYHAGQNSSKCETADPHVNITQIQDNIWNYINDICQHNPTATIPDVTKCSYFLDCSVPSLGSQYVDYLLECPYPALYSTQTGACQHYTSVMCGRREEPKAPCEYSQFQQLYNCSGQSCPDCEAHHPSCVGLTNGRHPLASKTNVLIECHTERTVNVFHRPS